MLAGQVIVGAASSTTVTVALPLLLLPLASRAVSVTVLAPKFEQLNVLLLMLRTRLPLAVQLSEQPLFTEDAVMAQLPVPSRWTVISWHRMIGGVVSCTVTVKVQVVLLPAPSEASVVTVVVPFGK